MESTPPARKQHSAMIRRLFYMMVCAGLLGTRAVFAEDAGTPLEMEGSTPLEAVFVNILPPPDDALPPDDTAPARPHVRDNSRGDALRTGTLIFLALLAALGVAAMVERAVNLRLARVVPGQLPARAAELWKNKKYAELSTLCGKDGSVLGRVIGTLIEHRGNGDVTLVKMLAEDKARRELRLASRRTGTLLMIATIAPLIGLSGTFAGLFNTFMTVEGGPVDFLPVEIAKALSTTVAGLLAAMPMLLFYQFFRSRANFFAILLEEEVSKLVNAWFVKKIQ